MRPLHLERGGRNGYVLRADEEHVDLLRFRRLTSDAHRASPQRAVVLLDGALRLWRGGPVADVPAVAGHPQALALTNERISTVLWHAVLTDALGRHDCSLPVLRVAVEEHPLHEPLWGRYVVALAGSGLQAEALDAYDVIRRRLADDLGIDPGPELSESRQRVLRQHWPGPMAAPRYGVARRCGDTGPRVCVGPAAATAAPLS